LVVLLDVVQAHVLLNMLSAQGHHAATNNGISLHPASMLLLNKSHTKCYHIKAARAIAAEGEACNAKLVGALLLVCIILGAADGLVRPC